MFFFFFNDAGNQFSDQPKHLRTPAQQGPSRELLAERGPIAGSFTNLDGQQQLNEPSMPT